MPVVYLTAHSDQDTVDRATITEPLAYVLKPVTEGNLRSAVQVALYKSEMERRLGDDTEARRFLFDWSMVECLEHYLDDERLQSAYMGQGVIGTNASPHDPGTASIHFHHNSGRLGGMPGNPRGRRADISAIDPPLQGEGGASASERRGGEARLSP